MIYTIEEIKAKSIPVAIEYGVKSMSIFGSYAKGNANDKSDIDFLIDAGNITDLFELMAFIQDLEEILKCHVDVVTTGIDDEYFLSIIRKEEVLIYER